MTNFRINGLAADQFAAFFEMPADALAKMNIKRQTVDDYPGYPCRVSLQDAAIGETVLLLPYAHQPAYSPYRSSGPIYVREAANQAILAENAIPEMLRHRTLSLRAYNADDMMITARVTAGTVLEETILALFKDARVAYLHIHNAGPGCFNCQVDRC